MRISPLIVLGLGLGAGLVWGACSGSPPMAEARTGRKAPVSGFRRVLADWLWLKTNLAWEQQEAERTRRLMGFTLRADPQTPYFWQNSARMLAYDFPAWREGEAAAAPAVVRRQWRCAAAEEALALLEQGQAWHGESAVLATEMGGIALYGLGDRQRAARYFARAAEQADAPAYARRLAEQLAEGVPPVSPVRPGP